MGSCTYTRMYQKMFFVVSNYMHFFHYTYFIRAYLLLRKSTLVDQNLESESINSQLSIAIFKAPRDLLVAQDDSIYK